MNTKDAVLKNSLNYLAIAYDNQKIAGVKEIAEFVDKQMKIEGWNLVITPKYVGTILREAGISTEKRGHDKRAYPVVNREVRNKIGLLLKKS